MEQLYLRTSAKSLSTLSIQIYKILDLCLKFSIKSVDEMNISYLKDTSSELIYLYSNLLESFGSNPNHLVFDHSLNLGVKIKL